MSDEPLTPEQKQAAKTLGLAMAAATDVPLPTLLSLLALHLFATMTPHTRVVFLASIRRRFPEAFEVVEYSVPLPTDPNPKPETQK